MSTTLILWGYHPAHANGLPLKLAEASDAERTRRESEGWKCATYPKGAAPDGLIAEAIRVRKGRP